MSVAVGGVDKFDGGQSGPAVGSRRKTSQQAPGRQFPGVPCLQQFKLNFSLIFSPYLPVFNSKGFTMSTRLRHQNAFYKLPNSDDWRAGMHGLYVQRLGIYEDNLQQRRAGAGTMYGWRISTRVDGRIST